MLLKTLRFVRGSVAKKDLLPALTSFRIEGGRVQGFNGSVAISVPINFDIDCTPKAVPLVNAIDKCTADGISFTMTPSGKLSVKSGKFRAYIECIEGPTAHVTPTGETLPIDGTKLLQALTTLEPLMGSDASKPWSNGIRLDGCSAYATCNVIAAQYWLGAPFPLPTTIPRQAVKELLRIGEPPMSIQVGSNGVTFHYETGMWVWAATLVDPWPDFDKVIGINAPAMRDLPEDFFEALESVKPFVDKYGRVILEPGIVRTTKEGDECGAVCANDWVQNVGHFSVDMLLRLQKVAKRIDLSCYPGACPWQGDNVRGAIIGLHQLENV